MTLRPSRHRVSVVVVHVTSGVGTSAIRDLVLCGLVWTSVTGLVWVSLRGLTVPGLAESQKGGYSRQSIWHFKIFEVCGKEEGMGGRRRRTYGLVLEGIHYRNLEMRKIPETTNSLSSQGLCVIMSECKTFVPLSRRRDPGWLRDLDDRNNRQSGWEGHRDEGVRVVIRKMTGRDLKLPSLTSRFYGTA